MIAMAFRSEVKAKKDLPEALVRPLQNETMNPDKYRGKKGVMIDQRHLIVDLETMTLVKEIDTIHFLLVELIDQLLSVTISLATCDTSLRSNIHKLT